MKHTLKYVFAALAVSALAASATPVPLVNASFETDIAEGWGPANTFFHFPGRLAEGGITTTSLAANDGSAYARIDSGVANLTPDGGDSMYHTIGLTAGQEYELTFAVATSSADNADTADTAFSIAIYTGSWAAFAESTWQSITQDGDTWTDVSYTFTADATADFQVGIRNRTDVENDGYGTLYVDNARLDAIPEPATLGLVAAFGGAVLFIRRKLAI